jgi:SAM-dependent methyltransferase
MTTWRDAQKYLSSLWLLDRDDDRSLDFHGAFVPAVAEGLNLRHTQPGDWILDLFGGSGTTKTVADRLGRNSLSVDLNPTNLNTVPGDARTIKFYQHPHTDVPVVHAPRSCWSLYQFDMVILHPPYHNIIRFSEKSGDLSNCDSVDDFLNQWDRVVWNAARHLKPGGYLGIVIGDIWIDRETSRRTGEPYGCYPLGFKVMNQAMCTMINYGHNPILKAIVVKDIKNNRHNAGRKNLLLSRFFRWGTVDFQHEYIFSIQKGKR